MFNKKNFRKVANQKKEYGKEVLHSERI